MLLENTKAYIDLVLSNNYSSSQLLKVLYNANLTRDEKNFVYLYCFPRPLLDRELPPRVIKDHFLRGDISNRGSLSPNISDVSLILEAGRTEQYGRFIKHLMNAFCNELKLFKISDSNVHECPICGKKIFGEGIWTKIGSSIDPSREYLAFGSTGSSITMCLDCIVQLNAAKETVEAIDSNFLW